MSAFSSLSIFFYMLFLHIEALQQYKGAIWCQAAVKYLKNINQIKST